MGVLHADTLVIEHPWGFGKVLMRTRYQVTVRDERDTLLATVAERRGPGALKLVRMTQFSASTPFELAVTDPGGTPVLSIEKGFTLGKGDVRVTDPTGTPIGSVRYHGHRDIRLSDPAGQVLCLLGDVARFEFGVLAKRGRDKVRRDTLRLTPGLTHPVRTLAVATALAFEIVRGNGTATGNESSSFPGA
ncbi:hypothetical protein [Alloactinosynnema sp. L-07]|uniref:hypothetical protein n=1 Tax=Alloactinosynnema sp. L-07 TaxID=1653480 RepID=UPI00065EF480|nr:hypothetical protein [Alloactinosynnema sp. L-07]CRK60056.1 hypothetical protein [Alloactinosynnema sp. L-07]